MALPSLAIAAAALLLAPALASADTSSTLTVVGTSDVSDSGMIPNLIQPQFQKAYPQFTFKYVGSATGAAIQNAESGTGGPSALIVHAASLENQFVAGGYSYNNEFGNAIFTNDFVLAGPAGDPAGVGANAAHNIAQAFADIAAAGSQGKVTFLSRGGASTASGTTVEEHQIWQLVSSSGLQPTSLVLCDVSAADGGGMTPISSSVQSTSGQPCPDSGTVLQPHAPPWYLVTGVNQAQNVIETNACNGISSGPNTCYVLSDRGTFDYLTAGQTAAGTTPNLIPNLKILTRDDSTSAPGGADELVNYFHAYIINPTKPGETVNLPAAQDFVNFLTSPALQAQVKTYLRAVDSGGPPFVADASPSITDSGIPTRYKAGKPITVTGTVTNAEPGYPVLAGKTVNVDELVAGVPVPVASGTTSATGAYSIKFTPTWTGSYEVSTGQISQIENATLRSPFGDLLSPAATATASVTVQSQITKLVAKSLGGKALVTGSVAPGSGHVSALLTVLARVTGSKRFKAVATDRLGTSDGNFAVVVPLAARRWQIEVKFKDPKQVLGTTSRTVKLTVGAAPSVSVSLRSLNVKNGSLKLAGTVTPATPPGGASLELLALKTAVGAPASFHVIAKPKVGAGKTKFTLKAKLERGARWVLELEYVQKGEVPGFSKLRTIDVS